MPKDKEPNTVYKTFTCEVKAVNEEDGTVDMLIPMNTDSVDRDGEIVEPSGAKKSLRAFMKRPILVSSHNYFDLRKQIGQFIKLTITDEGLMADGIKYYAKEGNQEADWAFNLASKGMAAFSIGFIPKKWVKIDDELETEYQNRRYTEWELLEISQVVVPSNRDAIQGVRAKAAAANDLVVTSMMDKMEAALDGTGPLVETQAATAEPDTSVKKDVPAVTVTKPLPNEHACRLKDPAQYDTWPATAAQGRAHCKAHDGKFEAAKVEGAEPPDKQPKAYTQGQLTDDMDYLLANLKEVGMGEEATKVAASLASELIQRLPGADIPDDIFAKIGVVLAENNRERLAAIQQLAQDILDNAQKPSDGEKQPVLEPQKPRITHEEIAEISKVVIAQLKGKRIPK